MKIQEQWINVFGVPVALSSRADIVKWCENRLKNDEKTRIVTANPEILLRARRDIWFKRVIEMADLVTPDGAGVCWAAAFFGMTENSTNLFEIIRIFLRTLWVAVFGRNARKIFPERVSGSDLLWDIAKIACERNLKVYLIGGKRATAHRAARRISAYYPGLDIKGFVPDHVATPYSSYVLHDEISNFKPAIVFVAYGSPKQEEWINQNMHRYPSIQLAMGVGGALDFIAGNASRAPLRLQNHALEWFWRLYQRPSRLIRVLRAVILFPIIILLSRIKKHYAKKF